MQKVECEALLFDLDGTLVDSMTCIEYAWRVWCVKHNIDFDDAWKRIQGKRAGDSIRMLAPHLDILAETAELEEAEVTCTEGLIAVEGALDLLGHLPKERWAVVTSGAHRLASHRLQHVGIEKPEVFVTAEDVVEGKPHPECYLKAAEMLGVSPEKCVVVEDAPAGINAGLAAGMKVLALSTTYSEPELANAHYCIKDFRQLKLEPGNGSLKFILQPA